MAPTAQKLIETLGLSPHPEGGFYAETFRSSLPVRSGEHPATRSASTAIYFLLRSEDFSAFHRVRSDEVWHHYLGDALILTMVRDDGTLESLAVGSDLSAGQRPQAVVPRGVLQAAKPQPGPLGYVLCGCTVAPGFDFADFEMPPRDVLTRAHPQHATVFEQLCR